MPAGPESIHATCVAIAGKGVLLRGPSGSGKSDLALRLMHLTGPGLEPALLVADDRVVLECRDGVLYAQAPQNLVGRIEVRGLGILTFDALPSVPLALAIDLVPPAGVERMPDRPSQTELMGIRLPAVQLTAFEPSAPLKVVLALRHSAR